MMNNTWPNGTAGPCIIIMIMAIAKEVVSIVNSFLFVRTIYANMN